MIVDDNVDAAHTLGMLCEQLGHDVDFAYDGVKPADPAFIESLLRRVR